MNVARDKAAAAEATGAEPSEMNTAMQMMNILISNHAERPYGVGNRHIRHIRRWRPTADWHCLASGRVATQACVCRLWAVAFVASASGPVTRAH